MFKTISVSSKTSYRAESSWEQLECSGLYVCTTDDQGRLLDYIFWILRLGIAILRFLFLVLADDALDISRLSFYSKSISVYSTANRASSGYSLEWAQCRRACTHGSAPAMSDSQKLSCLRGCARTFENMSVLWLDLLPSEHLVDEVQELAFWNVNLMHSRITTINNTVLTSVYSVQSIILFCVHTGELLKSILADLQLL